MGRNDPEPGSCRVHETEETRKRIYLEIGPERNRNTRRERFDDQWMTLGRSKKTSIDVNWDIDRGIPFEENRFDIVFGSHVLEHLVDPVDSLRECLRVLVPGGTCRMNVPNAKWLVQRWLAGKCGIDHMMEQLRSYQKGLHRWAFDQKKMTKCFEDAGFVDVRILRPEQSGVALLRHPYFSNRPNRTIYCEGVKP